MSGRRPPVSPDEAARALNAWASLYAVELRYPHSKRTDPRELRELKDPELFALRPDKKPTETIRVMHDEARGWVKRKDEE